jgi:hypothetical protein
MLFYRTTRNILRWCLWESVTCTMQVMICAPGLYQWNKPHLADGSRLLCKVVCFWRVARICKMLVFVKISRETKHTHNSDWCCMQERCCEENKKWYKKTKWAGKTFERVWHSSPHGTETDESVINWTPCNFESVWLYKKKWLNDESMTERNVIRPLDANSVTLSQRVFLWTAKRPFESTRFLESAR